MFDVVCSKSFSEWRYVYSGLIGYIFYVDMREFMCVFVLMRVYRQGQTKNENFMVAEKILVTFQKV